MTTEQKIKYMEYAGALCHFHLKERDIDLLVHVYEAVIKKEGEFSLYDAAKIYCDVEEREKERNEAKALDKFKQ